MKKPTAIQIEGPGGCVIDSCEFRGFGAAVSIEGGNGNLVTRSHFRGNDVAVRIRAGVGHAVVDSVFEGSVPPPREEGLRIIRERLSLAEMPDREILASLHAVLRENNEEMKRDAAQKSTLGRWLIEHGSDVNIAVNTPVTLATAVAQWFK